MGDSRDPPFCACIKGVGKMIELTRYNGGKFFLNITHIEVVEATPDTVITLINGKKMIVKETAQDIANFVTAFYQRAHSAAVLMRHDDDTIE